MEKKSGDIGPGKALKRKNVFISVITEANLAPTSVALDVGNQHKDGKAIFFLLNLNNIFFSVLYVNYDIYRFFS